MCGFAEQPLQPAIPSAFCVLPLLDLTLADVAACLDNVDFTVFDLVKACLERIDEGDGCFRSIFKTNPHAEAIACSLDGELKICRRRG